MIDRSYLPFKSARSYQDRQMAKWMGFFISEHTTALNQNGETLVLDPAMPLDEKLLLMSQAYLMKAKVTVTVGKDHFTGVITLLNQDHVGIHGHQAYHQVKLADIRTLQLAEADEDLDTSTKIRYLD